MSKRLPGRTNVACNARAARLDLLRRKDSLWTPTEEALLMELRGNRMSWEDVSSQLPGRTTKACRAHYFRLSKQRKEQ
jgi:hypothetical protein